ncbi:MAG: 50S ribosomal protein L32 [Flavobacteriales bacterium]|nr:50S ribosomal protein L32 [Flavobacteriales bacterium]
MAHPKRKISKTRRDKRRTHDKLVAKQLIKDPKTGEVSQYHRLNLETGMYRGKQVLEVSSEA